WGFRPLVVGRLGGAYIVCSETCALDLIDAEHVRDVEPGELLVIDGDGLRSFRPFPPEPVRQCVFEHVYFARPDSEVFGRNVLASRLALERQLARATTRSCAEPRPGRSSAWSGRPAPARSTSGSAARPPPAPATTGSTPPPRVS